MELNQSKNELVVATFDTMDSYLKQFDEYFLAAQMLTVATIVMVPECEQFEIWRTATIGLYTNNPELPAAINNNLLSMSGILPDMVDTKHIKFLDTYTHSLTRFLRELPPFEGEVFIAVPSTSSNRPMDRRGLLPGCEVSWPCFVSGSTLWPVAMDTIGRILCLCLLSHIFSILGSSDGVMFLIHSHKCGRFVSPLSQFPYDLEVIFPPCTQFKVTQWFRLDVIALGQANIRTKSFGMTLEEMNNSQKGCIIELEEL